MMYQKVPSFSAMGHRLKQWLSTLPSQREDAPLSPLLLLLFFWRIQPKKNSRKQRRKSRRREPLHPQQPRSLRLGADSFIDWRTVHRGCCSQCVVFNLPQSPYRLYASRNRRSKLDGGLLLGGM